MLLKFQPAQYFIHHYAIRRSQYLKSLVMHMVNSAKLCISAHWNFTQFPTISEWFVRINKIEEMEEMVHQSPDRMGSFVYTLTCSVHYKSTDAYSNLMSPSALL